MSKNTSAPKTLQAFGQSLWLDYIGRALISSGELRRMIDTDGLRGVTSNPAIFAKGIVETLEYRTILDAPQMAALDPKMRYETLAIRDVKDAADELLDVYKETSKRDGYVSLEVSPLLANDSAGTLHEARRLWQLVARDNLMIKVPATPDGIFAIRQLISEGINVNATLLFSQSVYEQVAEAYIDGLEIFLKRGGDLHAVAGVASFFVSRIDTVVDALIATQLTNAARAKDHALLRSLSGKVAIANAKLAYQRYGEIVAGARWQALAEHGAQTQRLLWASTGVKQTKYRDVLYVEELIGADTVNTMPLATLNAFRDHGLSHASLTEHVDAARDTMSMLADVGISMRQVTDRLLEEGVKQFADAFQNMLSVLSDR